MIDPSPAVDIFSITPVISEVMKDTDTTEPDWFEFPVREELEKILPKKYWAKPSKLGIEAPLFNLRYRTFFNSDGDVESMDLDISADSKDSLISVEKGKDTMPSKPVILL
jgi:hypothetical protein